MEVKTYQVGQIGTNCYFVGDEASKKGCMIDPGDEAENLIRLWGAFGYELSAILVTHGHFDHTTALAAVARHPGLYPPRRRVRGRPAGILAVRPCKRHALCQRR